MTKELYDYTDLFEAVQMHRVFADGKTFPDCIANLPLEVIANAYENEKNDAGFNLTAFVNNYFIPPVALQNDYHAQEENVTDHINNLWAVLTRKADTANAAAISSLIPLPFPYIVPGGRFGEIYYWDSYFTMLGLQSSGRIDLVQSMIDNFSYLIDNIGYIPNGNRSYFIGRSQPPFYSLMIALLASEKGDDIFLRYLPNLEKEHAFWMHGSEHLTADHTATDHVVRMSEGIFLNRYWDAHDTPRPESYREDAELAHHIADKSTLYRHIRAGAESGWDFSCRWFKNVQDFGSIHTTDIIPVDLNCLLLHLEEILCKCYALAGNELKENDFVKKILRRKAAIHQYCWNEEKQCFYDYDFVAREQKELQTIAAVFPLHFGLASHEQAKAIAELIENKFLQPGGITTTFEHTGQQWDAPNGWAPLQWITIQGLNRYGFSDLAKDIAIRWISLNRKVYARTGKLMEKYNVYDTALDAGGGEYPSQDGFGWTNGVLLRLIKMYDR